MKPHEIFVALFVVLALALTWAAGSRGGDASGPGDLGRCDVGAQTRWC